MYRKIAIAIAIIAATIATLITSVASVDHGTQLSPPAVTTTTSGP